MSKPDLILEKKLNRIAAVLTVVVLGLVAAMGNPHKIETGIDFSFLPPFHSMVNAITAVLLVAALIFIKKKDMILHRKMIYAAMLMSVLFLASYVLYHFTTRETLFGDANHDHIVSPDELAAVGGLRALYFVLLFSHIALAGLGFPFILLTFIRAYTGQYERHKRMARWVWWVWFYIAVTGPICYLMLKPYY